MLRFSLTIIASLLVGCVIAPTSQSAASIQIGAVVGTMEFSGMGLRLTKEGCIPFATLKLRLEEPANHQGVVLEVEASVLDPLFVAEVGEQFNVDLTGEKVIRLKSGDLFVAPRTTLRAQQRPNKAPEPTPRAVTPRATERVSK